MTEEVQEQSISELLSEAMSETTEETEAEEVSTPTDESEPVEEADAEEPVEAEEDSEGEEPETVFQPPEHWSSDEKAQFSALPPEAQAILLERDKHFQSGYQERVQSISDIESAIEPWKQHLAQRGVTADQAIRNLFAIQAQIESNPADGILWLAQNYGVLDQLKTQFAPDTDGDFIDPEVKALNDKIAKLEGLINQTNQTVQQAQTSTAQEQLNQFVSAVDADGKKVHQHYDAVRELMAPLVAQGKSLEDAYAETVWTVPEYREAQVAKPKVNEVEKARKVKQAKKAARGINQDGTAKSTESDEELSIADGLKLAWKQHS